MPAPMTPEQANAAVEMDRMAVEIIAMHSDIYHPGRDCPTEDEDGACAVRSGKPAVLEWTDRGVIYTSYGEERLGCRS